jgi:ADP-dependent phosphofructokinase/glucokinase
MISLLQSLKKTYQNNKKSSRIFEDLDQQIHNLLALKKDKYKQCEFILTKNYNVTKNYQKNIADFVTQL